LHLERFWREGSVACANARFGTRQMVPTVTPSHRIMVVAAETKPAQTHAMVPDKVVPCPPQRTRNPHVTLGPQIVDCDVFAYVCDFPG
jgi:hypothetical protein